MTRKTVRAIAVSREVIERSAHILGPQSGAAQALRDADARVARGESVMFLKAGSSILVGPRPDDAPEN